MSNLKQCKSVKDIIAQLQSLDQDSLLIFDWWTQDDIEDMSCCLDVHNRTEHEIKTIMHNLDDTFDFSLGNIHTNDDALLYMMCELESTEAVA